MTERSRQGLTDAQRQMLHSDMDYLGQTARRWTLWIAIGNAGGLVALGGRILEAPGDTVAYLLFPSCWLFAVGLIAIGASTWGTLQRFHAAIDGWFARADGRDEKPIPTAFEKLSNRGATLSAVLFLMGLFYPLLVVTKRYLTSGSFTG